MIRPIVRDPLFLAQKSAPATEADSGVIADLLDTLCANLDRCVGMAANMIGVRRRIIVFVAGAVPMVMVNPQLIEGKSAYETEEGCLSLAGTRKARRFRTIRVRYLDRDFRPKTGTFEGFTAQIIQHEMDHCEGILI